MRTSLRLGARGLLVGLAGLLLAVPAAASPSRHPKAAALRPDAISANVVTVTVTGSALTNVTTSPIPMTTSFRQQSYDYAMYCQAGTNDIQVSLASAGTISVGNQSGSSLSTGVQVQENQAIVLVSPDPDNPTGPPTEYWIRCLPHDFPVLQVNEAATSDPEWSPGWYVTGNITASSSSGYYAMVLDGDGVPVWYQKDPTGAGNAEALPDASNPGATPDDTIAWAPNLGPGVGAGINGDADKLFNLNSGATSQLVAPTYPTDPHELFQDSQGNRWVISTPLKSGVDLSSLQPNASGQTASQASPTGDPSNANIVDCVIQEISPQGEPLWTWDAADHIGPDEANTTFTQGTQAGGLWALDSINVHNYWQAQTVPGSYAADIYHCNSISVDPANPDHVLISSRHASALFLIDKATGNVIWKLGGTPFTSSDPESKQSPPAQYLTPMPPAGGDPSGESPQSCGQHDAEMVPTSVPDNGHNNGGEDVTIYDDHSDCNGAARGVEYAIDTEAGTATIDYQYKQPQGYSVGATGSFQRLPDPGGAVGSGSSLIGWGFSEPLGSAIERAAVKAAGAAPFGAPEVTTPFKSGLTEVDSQGNTIFDVRFPDNEVDYRAQKVPADALNINTLRATAGYSGPLLPPAPTVTSVSPSTGTTSGGTSVTITGANFATGSGATTFDFGTKPATNVSCSSSTSCSVESPPHNPGSVDVTAVTSGGTSYTSSADRFTFQGLPPGRYYPLPPARILDTRTGLGSPAKPVGPGSSLDIQVTGSGGVPSGGVAAVVLNVTATDTTATSYLTVYPAGTSRPLASNMNWTPGETVPNLVEVPVSSSGQVSLYNAQGSVNLVADVEGYVADAADGSSTAGLFEPAAPTRVLDTRTGLGAPKAAPVGNNSSINLSVAGQGPVPATGVSAVVLNVTVTNPTTASFLTVYPAGSSQPAASNLNFSAGQTVAGRVIVPVGANGSVTIYNANGSTDVVADVGGWFTDGSDPSATGDYFTAAAEPTRVLDTRYGTGESGPIGPGSSIGVGVAGSDGVSPDAAAVVANLTVADTTSASYLTAYPGTQPAPPTASDLNWPGPNSIIANLAVSELGSNGSLELFNDLGSTDVIVDVEGWYSP